MLNKYCILATVYYTHIFLNQSLHISRWVSWKMMLKSGEIIFMTLAKAAGPKPPKAWEFMASLAVRKEPAFRLGSTILDVWKPYE